MSTAALHAEFQISLGLHDAPNPRNEIATRQPLLFLDLGDFRRGSITAIQGRCGKPNCHCHLPNQHAHGPNFRLTFKVRGKTVSETFSSPSEMRKVQREVDTFHRFQQLSQQLLEVNEKFVGHALSRTS